MNISLTPELEELIKQKVAGGMYHSASEVIREALRLLKERDEHHQMRIEQLRRDIQIGLDQIARGEVRTLDEDLIEDIKQRGRRRLAEAQGVIRKKAVNE